MNEGWYGALKEAIQQQQNQLVWVSEGKVRNNCMVGWEMKWHNCTSLLSYWCCSYEYMLLEWNLFSFFFLMILMIIWRSKIVMLHDYMNYFKLICHCITAVTLLMRAVCLSPCACSSAVTVGAFACWPFAEGYIIALHEKAANTHKSFKHQYALLHLC